MPTPHRDRRLQHGASVLEFLIAAPVFGLLSLGAIQLGMLYVAKSTLNYATFEAARTGSMANAQSSPMKRTFARHLITLYGASGNDLQEVCRAYSRAYADVLNPLYTRFEILNPTLEAFDDFGVEVDGQRQIPNEHLAFRPRTVGSASGVTIQDANLLKIRVAFAYPLKVPFVNRLIGAAMRLADPANAALYSAEPYPRLPLVAEATVRMQSRAYEDGNAHAPSGSSSGGGSGGTRPGEDTGSPPPPDQGGGEPPKSPREDPPLANDDDLNHGAPGNSCPDTTQLAATSTGLPALSVGNPIHVASGNKYQRELDLTPLPGVLGLEFTRHYNSRSRQRRGVLGAGWTHFFEVRLWAVGREQIVLRQADGRVIRFAAQTPPDSSSPRRPSPLPAEAIRPRAAAQRASKSRSGSIAPFCLATGTSRRCRTTKATAGCGPRDGGLSSMPRGG